MPIHYHGPAILALFAIIGFLVTLKWAWREIVRPLLTKIHSLRKI